jgi:hypothetical protein
MATLPKVLISRADYQIGGGVALGLRTQEGRMMSIFARNMTRSAVEQEAKLLFSYVQEREAFTAGYEGERRRRAELVP